MLPVFLFLSKTNYKHFAIFLVSEYTLFGTVCFCCMEAYTFIK